MENVSPDEIGRGWGATIEEACKDVIQRRRAKGFLEPVYIVHTRVAIKDAELLVEVVVDKFLPT